MTTKQRYREVIDWFEHNMPVAETELHYSTPFELLVAVILSAQCTDKRINMVTPALFEAYPTAEAMSKASVDDIFQYTENFPNVFHISPLIQKDITFYCFVNVFILTRVFQQISDIIIC